MNDLDTLRPEVREAVGAFDIGARIGMIFGNKVWNIIRAELLRLQSTESRANEWQLRAERAEAELAALKARIAASMRAYHSSFEYTLDASTLYARATGIPGEETYALVKVEE